jgi:hypothetical protein
LPASRYEKENAVLYLDGSRNPFVFTFPRKYGNALAAEAGSALYALWFSISQIIGTKGGSRSPSFFLFT